MKQWIDSKKVMVCCGAGGVGKTTLSAALALECARQGHRTLVLTIDPSLRLAQALGVKRNSPEPLAVSTEFLGGSSALGGSLDAWMLDPQVISDKAVVTILGKDRKSEAEVQRFLRNRVYGKISQFISGMQEYTALKALSEFIDSGRYDRIILDTPPSRHALDFLDAPTRVAEFLEGRIFQMFAPTERGWLGRAAGSVVQKVVKAVFGESFAQEMTEFISLFSGVFQYLNADLARVRSYLAGAEAGFWVVSSPRPAPLEEARFFLRRSSELKLPVLGVVLNQGVEGAVQEETAESFSAQEPELLRQLVRLENHWIQQERVLLQSFKSSKEMLNVPVYSIPWVQPSGEVGHQLRDLMQSVRE